MEIHETLIVGQVHCLHARVYTQSDSCVCTPIAFLSNSPISIPFKQPAKVLYPLSNPAMQEDKLVLILKWTAAPKHSPAHQDVRHDLRSSGGIECEQLDHWRRTQCLPSNHNVCSLTGVSQKEGSKNTKGKCPVIDL